MRFSLYNVFIRPFYSVGDTPKETRAPRVYFTSGNHDPVLDPIFRRRSMKVEVEDCRFDPTESCWKPTGITEKVYLPFFDRKLAN